MSLPLVTPANVSNTALALQQCPFTGMAMPEESLTVAQALLAQIIDADSANEASRVHCRADGFVYGQNLGKVIADDVAGRMWVVFQNAHDERRTQLLDNLRR